MNEVHGWVAPGWDGVRAAFEANLRSGSEVGAAFSAYHRGDKVVDLWGGVADLTTGAPWAEDTIVLVYSTTKGATAVCAHHLAQQGLLDLDAPVSEYWPGFGQAGKEGVPVRWLLSHRVGLPYFEGVLTAEEAYAWDPVVRALETASPVWEPGTKHGYHASTYGYLVGEVVRRITGRTIGTYLRDEIAGPLGLDLWIGLPESEEPRVARLVGGLGAESEEDQRPTEDPEEARRRAELAELLNAFIGPDTELGKALAAPGGAFAVPGIFNTRGMRAAEMPAANMVGDARSVARLYAAVIGDVVEGSGRRHERLLSPGQVAVATAPDTAGPDVVLFGLDLQFGLGFMLNGGYQQMGRPGSFGHFGMGGSVGWADPEAELAIGYVMNRMDMGVVGDTRSSVLTAACYDALG